MSDDMNQIVRILGLLYITPIGVMCALAFIVGGVCYLLDWLGYEPRQPS